MVSEPMAARVRLKNFEAVIFDLDGVITDSASIHAVAWKALFDEYLGYRAKKLGQEYVPFELDHDYRKYVDGKPRYEGVQSFLESRSVRLARGTAQDAATRETICGLGNRKDKLFTHMLRRDGVKLFGPTIRLILRLHGQGVRCGVASSSKNCRLILRTAGIEAMFQARVDGVVSDQLGLNGKPAPDIFLKCAALLRVPPNRAVVVEDAISGVQAGRRGGFALVIGLGPKRVRDSLARHGADVVVPSLSAVTPATIDAWCETTRTRRRSV